MRAEKFKMASKMAAEVKRTGLSLGSLQRIFANRVTAKITCEYCLIYIRKLNDKERLNLNVTVKVMFKVIYQIYAKIWSTTCYFR